MDEHVPTLGLSADEVLTTTRAVRKRLDLNRRVPRAVIDDCVRIAMQAPSGRNRQHWDFLFVEDAALKRDVAGIWRRGLEAPWPPPELGITGQRVGRDHRGTAAWDRVQESLDHLVEHLHEAPVLVIPCLRQDDRRELQTIRGQAGGWGSAIPAFWSFMLAARERGLGTAWTTCHLSYEQDMAELLGIPFDTVIQIGLSPVAYTIGNDFRLGPRADQTDFTHWDRW
ncbi:nitroreductase family protein [Agromyces bauzanensis]